MTEQDLHQADVDALFQEFGGETVAQRVRCEAVAEIARIPCAVEGPARHSTGQMIGAVAVGEDPRPAAVDLPDLTQHGQGRFGEGQGSFFVAFADDPQEHPLGVDGRDGQRQGLADAQAAGVDQRETAAVDRQPDGGDQAAAVLVASNVGQAFAIGLADFFW